MEKVVIKSCDSYNACRLEQIIIDAIDELGLTPNGKVFIKPNEVIAHPKYFKNAYTHPAVLEATIRALKNFSVSEINIGGKAGLTIPTRHVFRHAGYSELIKEYNKIADKSEKRPKARAVYFDEEKQVKKLVNGEIHKEVHVPASFLEANFKIYLPKLKANLCSSAIKGGKPSYGITNALKLNLGIIDDKERVRGHNYNLDKKIADLLVIGSPNLIVTDAIIIGSSSSPLTAKPYNLGAIIIGKNAVAVDSVCAYILGYNPEEIGHIRECSNGGFGPSDLNEINIVCDIPLEDLRAKAKDWDSGRFPSELGYKNIRFYTGKMPENKYCFAGCPTAILEAISILEEFSNKSADNFFQDMAIVFGEYENRPNAGKIILAGSCSSIKNCRVDSSKISSDIHKLNGCPVTIPAGINWLWHYAGDGSLRMQNKPRNPYFDTENMMPFIKDFLTSKFKRYKNKLF